MPIETIPVIVAIVIFFGAFASTLAWAARQTRDIRPQQ